MDNPVRDLFITLSENQMLNSAAKRWGLKLGAQRVVAGVTIDDTINTIKKLNKQGINCTIDNLGEFVFEKTEAIAAKNQILQVVQAIHKSDVDAHISLKPSQLGLDIDYDFTYDNVEEIIALAAKYNIFINIDMESHRQLQPSFNLLDDLHKKYKNIGTVIQSYFYRAEEDLAEHTDLRLRLVKGAYKEAPEVAFQEQAKIDANYIKLIEWNLLNGKYTSIGTHDHHIINHVKDFVKQHDISKDTFEFQMLFGFREDLLLSLKEEGYSCCMYVPFGEDWYGYFMRRLAERPQNINLLVKQVFNKKTNTIIGLGVGSLILAKLINVKKKKFFVK